MKLEQEAKAYMSQKKKKLSAADRTVVRAYMSAIMGGYYSNGRVPIGREVEIIQEAYKMALRCLQFEKDNF